MGELWKGDLRNLIDQPNSSMSLGTCMKLKEGRNLHNLSWLFGVKSHLES